MIRFGLLTAIVVSIAIAASLNEYRHRELMNRVEANTKRLLTDPTARPDPWTGTDDREAMAALRVWVLQEIRKACAEQQQSQQD